MSAQGIEIILPAVGKRLTHARRFVLGLGRSNGPLGHGMTELTFEDSTLTVSPGPNEDYLEITSGPISTQAPASEHWDEVDLAELGWGPDGRLRRVDIYSDGLEDVALVFVMDSLETFSLVLCDTDAALGNALELFDSDPNKVRPVLRTTIERTSMPTPSESVTASHQCPRCGQPQSIVYAHSSDLGGLRFTSSFRCSKCGEAFETDAGTPSEGVRSLFYREHGRWILRIVGLGPDKVSALQRVRKVLALTMPATAVLMRDLPKVVADGTRTEMAFLKDGLGSEVECEVVRALTT
jgi:hypothetical protein